MTPSARALARSLAARCRVLHQRLLDSAGGAESNEGAEAAAERQTFREFLASPGADQHDWTYLYQDFISALAPERRRALGVYYTPVQVVRAQVRLAAEVLEARLGCSAAYADPRVLVVDPAAGSGAYPLAVIGSSGQAVPARLHLLEPMIGAAALARAQLTAALRGQDAIRIEERDALDGPLDLHPPILVCLGNPPYKRRKDQGQPRARSIIADLVEPGAGLHVKNLYNDYVYFWRWALREVFEQRRGPGIVSFVTAASYLRGPGFAGMRRRLREVLDELWIIDLEGDHLAARRTHNVFPIRTPVAIGMGVRYSARSQPEMAAVHYARLVGTRSEKLVALDAVQRLDDVAWQSAPAGWHLPLVARARSQYERWPGLTDLFPRQLSGAQLKRTWPIAPTPSLLRERWARLLELPCSSSARATAFRETRDRNLDSTPTDLREPARRLEPLRALGPGAACIDPVQYAYRSFDRQWVLPDARLGDFMRPALWRIAGPGQVFLTSLLTNVVGPGPAGVATALVPDLDCFRGSFGARAVIPLWCDAQESRPNMVDGLLERLAENYGTRVSAPQVFAYCCAVLGTRGFQARFEDELRTPGPRVPITGDSGLFMRAATLGEKLVWLHTYGQRWAPPTEPAGKVPVGQARSLTPVGTGQPQRYTYDAEQHTLHLGEGSFAPVAPAVWTFSVSGLRVVPAWLGRRVTGPRARRRSSALDAVELHAWTPALSQELLELVWVVEATLAMEPELDDVLAQIVDTAGAQAAVAT